MLLSVKPKYASKILNGNKTVELRRQFGQRAREGSTVLIYASQPVGCIVGSAALTNVRRLPLRQLWCDHGDDASISETDFNTYFAGQTHGYALVLGSPRVYESAIRASDLREEFGIVPPQSYRYLTLEHHRLLNHERP